MLIVLLWLSFLYGSYNGAMVVALTEMMPAERAHGRVLARLLAGDRPVRRVHAAGLHLADRGHRQQGGARLLAGVRRRVRPVATLLIYRAIQRCQRRRRRNRLTSLDHVRHLDRILRNRRKACRQKTNPSSRRAPLGLAGASLFCRGDPGRRGQVVSSGGFAAAYKALAPDSSARPAISWSRAGGRRWEIRRTPCRNGSPRASRSTSSSWSATRSTIWSSRARSDRTAASTWRARASAGRAGGRPEAGHQHRGRAEAHAACTRSRSPIRTARAASISRTRCSSARHRRAGEEQGPDDPGRPGRRGGRARRRRNRLPADQRAQAHQGIDLVGPLPPEVQEYTVFSAGIVAGAQRTKPPAPLSASSPHPPPPPPSPRAA